MSNYYFIESYGENMNSSLKNVCLMDYINYDFKSSGTLQYRNDEILEHIP